MPQYMGGATEIVTPLTFQATDIADANGTLNTVQATTTEYVMPFAGSIIGVAGALNATLTTGTLTLRTTIDGSLCPDFPDAAALRTNQQRASYSQDAGKANFTFTAGQRIGLAWAKTGTVNPTTADAVAQVYVMLEGVRY